MKRYSFSPLTFLFGALSAMMANAELVDFDGITSPNLGAIPQTYQPVSGVTMTYVGVGLYNGGPDHTDGTTGGTKWNVFQSAGDAGTQTISFSQTVQLPSMFLTNFAGSATGIEIRATRPGMADFTDTFIPTAHAGAGNYVWKEYTGLAGVDVTSFSISSVGDADNGQLDDLTVNYSPVPLAVTSPSTRHIVQRDTANTGDIIVTGTYLGSPDRIEARAVVMAGASNSGATTAWQVIDAAPTGSSYSGVLADVPEGGWYNLEVRTVTGGVASGSIVIEKVGVGDVYVIAGQSNSANWGTPVYTPADDRVSVRLSVSGATWRHGHDPMPIADGGGGSAWSRLGDLLTARENVPIGFISVGVGGTRVDQWVPGTSHYDNRLKPALQSFPVNGFRAVLWHQGESDSIASTSKANYITRMQSVIAQSRLDASWQVPWILAEVSYYSTTNLSAEAQVYAAQRSVIHADPNVFLGPVTDDFHLEDAVGGKLRDNVHFNALGLSTHAAQWDTVLSGGASLFVGNPGFEKNTDPSVTTVLALNDNGVHSVSASDNSSPSVLDWRVLTASGSTSADGGVGYFNPGDQSYTNAIDSINGGVMPNMDGKHAAFFLGGSAGNHFIQTRRANLVSNHTYALTVALGIRDVGAGVYGDTLIELMANDQILASSTVTESDLDTLADGSASGKFTDVTLSYTTASNTTSHQPISIRVTKISGAGNSYVDFDNVRLTATPTRYGVWQNTYWGDTESEEASPDFDADQDGLANLAEFAFGKSPLSASHPQSILFFQNEKFTVTRRIPTDAGLSYTFQSSTTLEVDSWTTVSNLMETVTSSDAEFETVELTRPEGWGTDSREFYRILITPN